MIEFTKSITSKLPTVGTSIFTTMGALATKHDAVNLSQGFPDFDLDNGLIDLVTKYMKLGANQYAPMSGVPQLRSVLSDKLYTSYGLRYDVDSEITITAGATQAIFTAISTFIKDDDEVIIFTPAYDCYAPAITLNGGKAIYCPLASPDFKIDWQLVKKMITMRTKMIIINTPHNPTGSVASEEDMKMLESIVKDKDIIVLSDEVYEHIIFDDVAHESICKYPTLASQAMAVFSFGKTFHATGWKMGYIVGPERLMKEFRKVHQFNVFSCNTPVQYALAEYLANASNYQGLGGFYQEKRDFFQNAIRDSRFKLLPSKGTYFQLLSFEGISDLSDVDYAIELIEKYNIAAIPVSVFYKEKRDDKVLRFCFAKKEETLNKAAKILCNI